MTIISAGLMATLQTKQLLAWKRNDSHNVIIKQLKSKFYPFAKPLLQLESLLLLFFHKPSLLLRVSLNSSQSLVTLFLVILLFATLFLLTEVDPLQRITILVAAEGIHKLQPINGTADLKEALQKIGSMSRNKIMVRVYL